MVTPEGFPLAYGVLPGDTADTTTLPSFLKKVETQYGKARRVWVMDRGIPTEEVLSQMRASDPPAHYLVGTPKGRLGQLGKELLDLPWQEARPGVEVKLLAQQGERYVLAKSHARVNKERAMRQRQHVVRAFAGVDEEAVAVGDEAGHEGVEVAADVGVRVFLDEEGGGGVADLQGAEAVLQFGGREFPLGLSREFDEAAAVRPDLDFNKRLFHGAVFLASCSRRRLDSSMARPAW